MHNGLLSGMHVGVKNTLSGRCQAQPAVCESLCNMARTTKLDKCSGMNWSQAQCVLHSEGNVGLNGFNASMSHMPVAVTPQ